jgi:hypothetical protein
MKTIFKFSFLLLIVFIWGSQVSYAQKKKYLIGNWSCYTPDAPAGFQDAILRITNDSVFTSFNGESYSYPSRFMKFENDTLTFEVTGIDALCTHTFENKTKLTGEAVWSSGQSKQTLTKISKPKKSKQN